MWTGGLNAQVEGLYGGRLDPGALLGEFREAVLWCPLSANGGLWSVESGGVRWLLAFSSVEALQGFAVARGAVEGEEWGFVTVRGWRLLDEAVPTVGGPVGVALDVGSRRPVLLPPVAGVVPERVAVV